MVAFNWTEIGTAFTNTSIMNTSWVIPLLMIAFAISLIISKDGIKVSLSKLTLNMMIATCIISVMYGQWIISIPIIIVGVIAIFIFVTKEKRKET